MTNGYIQAAILWNERSGNQECAILTRSQVILWRNQFELMKQY